MEYDSPFAILRRPYFAENTAWNAMLFLQDCAVLSEEEGWGSLGNERHPEIINALQDGLFVTSLLNSSPSLFRRVYTPLGKLKNKVPVDAISPLMRYLIRASYRAVPYAGFSGAASASVVESDHPCALQYGEGSYEVDASIDYELYSGFTDSKYQSCMEYINGFNLNPTLYIVAGRWHLYRQMPCSQSGRYVVESIVDTRELSALHEYMSRVSGVHDRKDLIDLLKRVSPESVQSASEFIDALLQQGFITSAMEFPCTVENLNHQLLANAVDVADANYNAKDAQYLTNNSRVVGESANYEWYGALDASVRSVFKSPRADDVKSSLVLDLVLPDAKVKISSESKSDLLKVAKLYALIGSGWDSPFHDYVSLFFKRYGHESVPLPIAIDEYYGVSLGGIREPDTSITAGVPKLSSSTGGAGTKQRILEKMQLELEACDRCDSKDLAGLLSNLGDEIDLPDTFYCLVEFLRDELGGSLVSLINFGGPSALRLAARFSKSNQSIRDALCSFSAKEAELKNNKLIADVIFRAGDRLPNVQVHPSIRNYEILISGSSSCSPENTIYLSELHLKFSRGELRLFCPRLNSEIIPRMSSAYNPNYRGIPAYKLLAELATLSSPRMIGLNRSYDRSGPKMYPRVTCGTVVIERKAWKVRHADFFRTADCEEDSGCTPVSELPRRVEFVYGDLCFPVQLDNEKSRQLIARYVKGKDCFYLRECFTLGGGDYRHEMILPFIACRHDEDKSNGIAQSKPLMQMAGFSSKARVPDESNNTRPLAQYKHSGKLLDSGWLSIHVYMPKIHMNRFLAEFMVSRLKSQRLAKMIDSYFFLRYDESGDHLRLRFLLKDGCVGSFVEVIISEIKRSSDIYGIWSTKIEPYYPEYERYGGSLGVAAAEAIFFLDSRLALRILSNRNYSTSESMEWKVAVFVMASYWEMCGLPDAEKLSTLRQVAASREGSGERKYVYDQKYREHQAELRTVLNNCERAFGRELAGLLIEWKAELQRLFGSIEVQLQSGKIRRSAVELIVSYVHMSMNRLNEYKQNVSEEVLYQILARHLYSELKRNR